MTRDARRSEWLRAVVVMDRSRDADLSRPVTLPSWTHNHGLWMDVYELASPQWGTTFVETVPETQHYTGA